MNKNTMNSSITSRKVYFDVLNILGTLFVVWIHFGNEVHWYDDHGYGIGAFLYR